MFSFTHHEHFANVQNYDQIKRKSLETYIHWFFFFKKSNALITQFSCILQDPVGQLLVRVTCWVFHFGLFVFICKQLYDGAEPACLEILKTTAIKRRADSNCNDLIHHSHMAQHGDRHPEDIKGTNCDEWKANSAGGITVTLRQEQSYLLQGFAHSCCQIIMIHYISRLVSHLWNVCSFGVLLST